MIGEGYHFYGINMKILYRKKKGSFPYGIGLNARGRNNSKCLYT